MSGGFDVTTSELTQVGQFIAAEEGYLSAVNLASVSEMLGTCVVGIDVGKIDDAAGRWTAALHALAQDVDDYGRSISSAARSYGMSDAAVEAAMGHLA